MELALHQTSVNAAQGKRQIIPFAIVAVTYKRYICMLAVSISFYVDDEDTSELIAVTSPSALPIVRFMANALEVVNAFVILVGEETRVIQRIANLLGSVQVY